MNEKNALPLQCSNKLQHIHCLPGTVIPTKQLFNKQNTFPKLGRLCIIPLAVGLRT